MNRERRTVLDVIFGEIRLAMDLWLRHPNAGLSEEAAEILAAWAHAHRLEDIADPAWDDLDALVRKGFSALCRAAENHDDPDAWNRDLFTLREAADDALSEEELRVCAEAALELFNNLDQAQLTAWAMGRKGYPGAVEFYKKWLPCDRLFRENLAEFVPIYNYARMMSDQYRRDLHEYDADLDLITAKYRLVLREWEEGNPDATASPDAVEYLDHLLAEGRERKIIRFPAASHALGRVGVIAPSAFPLIVDMLGRWLDSEKPSLAADVHHDDLPLLVIAGNDGGWHAHADAPREGNVSFFVMADGLPVADGSLCFGTLEGAIRDGTAVFALAELLKAAEAGATPMLKRAGEDFPGVWKNEE